MDKKYEDKAQRGADQTIRVLRKLPSSSFSGKRVMDVGANVGLVSRWLLDAGAQVTGYEPHPSAFTEAEARCPEATMINAALATERGAFTLRESKSDHAAGYHCNATLIAPGAQRQSNFVYLDIEVHPFAEALAAARPQGMKIDCEGSEYDLLLRQALPRAVEWLVIEFHKLNAVGAALFPAAIATLAAQGLGLHPLPTALRPGPGVVKSFWGFEVVTLTRGAQTCEEDAAWLATLPLDLPTRDPRYAALISLINAKAPA